MALSNAERQRLYIQRLKAKAAAVANDKQPGSRLVTNDLTIHAKAQLKRLARHRDCPIAALIERWDAAASIGWWRLKDGCTMPVSRLEAGLSRAFTSAPPTFRRIPGKAGAASKARLARTNPAMTPEGFGIPSSVPLLRRATTRRLQVSGNPCGSRQSGMSAERNFKTRGSHEPGRP
jgi:hypothetical protein